VFSGHLKFSRALGTSVLVLVMLLSIFCVVSMTQTAVAAAPEHAVELNITTPSPKWFGPSSTVQFSYRVKNIGAQNDTYWINTSCVPGSHWYQKGYRASVTLNKTMLLTNQSTASGVLSVTAPANASYPDVVDVTLYVESANSSASASDVVIVQVAPSYALAVDDIKTHAIAPGSSGKYLFNVTNLCNCNETFTVQVTWSPSGWTPPLLNYNKITLAPNEKMPVEMIVYVPTDASITGDTVQVKVSSDSSIISAYQGIDVLVKEVPGVEFTIWGDSLKEAEVDDNVLFNFQMFNTGNYQETLYIDFEYTTPCFNVYSSMTNKTLMPGSSAYVDMWVHVLNNTLPGTNELVINVTAGNVSERKSVFLDIQQIFSVELFCEAPEKKTDPPIGEYFYLDYNLTLKNSGNGRDENILLEAYGSSASWVSLNKEYISLDAGATENFTATVTIPISQRLDEYPFGIRGTSLAGYTDYIDSPIDTTITITADVQQLFELELSHFNPATGHLDLAMGGSGEYSISIYNHGNDADTCALKVIGDVHNWVSLEASALLVYKGNSRDVKLTVDVPNAPSIALAGNYSLTLEVTSEDKVTKQSIDVTFNIQQKLGVSLLSPDSVTTSSLALGEEWTYNLKIKNTGNDVDTLVMSMSGDKTEWLSFIGNTSFTLGPGESGSAQVLTRVPALDDVIDMDDVYSTDYYQHIVVTSSTSSTTWDILELVTHVKQYYDCEIEAISGDELVYNMNSESGNEYKFKVTNTGNKKDTIYLDAEYPTGVNVFMFDSTSTLSAGGSHTRTMSITFQSSFKGDSLSFRIIAVPGSGQSTARERSINVTDIQVKRSDLTIISITHNDEDGLARNHENIRLNILIANNGTEDLSSISITVEITINGQSYTRTVYGLAPGGTYELTYEWRFRRTEDTDFDIYVDATNRVIESNEMNNKKTLTMDSYGAGYEGGTPEASSTFIYVIIAIIFGLLAGVIVTAMFFKARAPRKPEAEDDDEDDEEEDDIYGDGLSYGQDIPQDDIYNNAISPGSVDEDLIKEPVTDGDQGSEAKQKFKQVDGPDQG